MDFGVDFCRFPEALGAVFITFVVLETSFKIDGFSRENRIQYFGVAVVNHTEF